MSRSVDDVLWDELNKPDEVMKFLRTAVPRRKTPIVLRMKRVFWQWLHDISEEHGAW